MGFKSPRAVIQSCKWLFIKDLRSKTLGQIQNLVHHRLMSPLKSKITPGEHSAMRHHFLYTAQHHTQSLASPIIVVHRSRPSASGERSDPTLKKSRLSLRIRVANNPRLLFRKSPASLPISPRKVGPVVPHAANRLVAGPNTNFLAQ